MSANPLTVLLVVDHAFDRLALADALDVAGFAVLEAADSDAALAVLRAHDNVSVMVAEAEIPGSMNGTRLAVTVVDGWPAVAIMVIASGGTVPAGIPERCVLLHRPYERNHVIKILRDMARGEL